MTSRSRLDGLAHLLIQNPKYAQAVMRGLALKGDLPQLTEPTVGLGLQLADLTAAPWQYLLGDDLVAGNATVGALAGNPSHVGVQWNPTQATKSILWIRRVVIQNNNAAAVGFRMGLSDGNPTNVIDALRYIDQRRGNSTTARSGWSLFGTTAAGPATYAQISVGLAASTSMELNVDYILRPRSNGTGSGGSFVVETAGNNLALSVSIFAQEINLVNEEAPNDGV